jgi:hypothetical protein
LGAKPSDSETKGDEEIGNVSGKLRIARTGSWHLQADKRSPEDLNSQIAQILSELTTDLAI